MARPGSVRGRRGGKQAEDPRGKWLTTYADAVTLLMAFFILLYAMSEIDVVKFTAFLEGLRVPFGNEAGDGLLPETDGLQPDLTPVNPADERPDAPDRLDEPADHEHEHDQEFEEEEPEPPEEIAEIIPEDLLELLEPERSPVPEEIVDLLEQRQQVEDQLDEVEEALDEAMQEHGLEMHVEMRREERGLVVSIASDDILFALGSTEINDLGRQVIRVVSDTLDGFPNPLFIEGHTDDIPLNRNGYTNWNLSTDRAVEVLKLMIEEHELPSDRVGAVGYGEYHPLATNDTPEGRARNRRVDIVVLVEEVEL